MSPEWTKRRNAVLTIKIYNNGKYNHLHRRSLLQFIHLRIRYYQRMLAERYQHTG